ncbi:bifunctional metallophosphatase/5'-nucleotidase [Marinivivus vitaminiproducens]|uniref:bifunctional metallophosphatase/5'-nucleotidase n=1 Tax=Marinivivus vitaminiproducens TaxID=3035935 RepID=UPI0027993566|nr:5'-nucleotidase C-terminal domain-containing protein [Geminicoccaceae bacterium SCSIO 64248]
MTGRNKGSVAAALGLTALLASGAAQAESLTFVHVNDFDRFDGQDDTGGFARYATVLKRARAEHENVIATNGGDMISPSLLSGLDKGAHMVDLNNKVGLDIAAIGNHEFDFGPDVAEQRFDEADYTVLGTNVLKSGQPFPHTTSYLLREFGTFTVGFFGLTTPETVDLASPGPDVTFADPVATAEKAAADLRAEGADIVVALTHMTIAEDRKVIALDGVDILLGGHDGELMTLYNDDGLLFKSDDQAALVGVLTFDVEVEEEDGEREITLHPGWDVVPTRGIEGDAETQALVAEYGSHLDRELGVAIGTTAVELDSRRGTIRGREAAFGNLIADATREAVGAQIAIINGGGIRADTTYPAGTTLTRRDILSELPFGNKTVLLEVSGATVLAALENGFSLVESGGGRFPQVSGMDVVYDPSQPPGERVVSVTVDGEDLDEDETYTLATNDFMLAGGDGYDAFADSNVLINGLAGRLMASQVIEYIEKVGTVSTGVEGRIQTVDD